MRAADVKCEMKVQIFVIVTNVFVSVTNPIAIFSVLIGHIDDTNNVPWQVDEPDVKEIEKDLGENFGPVLRGSKKKGEMS